MTYETLDDGVLLTDDAVEKLVADAYAALERGAYKVIPNPHKKKEPLKLSGRRRAELVKALSFEGTENGGEGMGSVGCGRGWKERL